MSPSPLHDSDAIQHHLRDVERLLSRQKLIENLMQRQTMPQHRLVENITHRQNLTRLRRKLDQLHPADIAYILEALPLGDRHTVWHLVRAEHDGDILLEVSDAVRDTLIDTMDAAELRAAAERLDADELADLAPALPAAVMREVLAGLDHEERAHVHAAMSYSEGTVGALMDFDLVRVREDVTLEVVLRYLRLFEALPDHTDKLFVVDREERLRGVLTLEALLINDVDVTVATVMQRQSIPSFAPEDAADDAANLFERYDLVSAPVINDEQRLIGRLTVADVVDHLRATSETEILNQAGLKAEEDIFAPVLQSLKNRWAWLAVNLVTAFIASRVIGLFEDTIAQLVALAALMPIVAGIGGNAGNQTITMIVRAQAMGQLHFSALWRLLRKELSVALINGILWGSVIGVLAWWLYANVKLGAVMVAAMTLNLLLAATAGVIIPLLRQRLGGDPALGSSVLITALTDAGGFFIFLGLATFILL